eukprot:m.55690 g.55690  ORF g.55690 m.55690 type:complete len:289 (-) comp12964_c2_seq2:833-1699(-)
MTVDCLITLTILMPCVSALCFPPPSAHSPFPSANSFFLSFPLSALILFHFFFFFSFPPLAPPPLFHPSPSPFPSPFFPSAAVDLRKYRLEVFEREIECERTGLRNTLENGRRNARQHLIDRYVALLENKRHSYQEMLVLAEPIRESDILMQAEASSHVVKKEAHPTTATTRSGRAIPRRARDKSPMPPAPSKKTTPASPAKSKAVQQNASQAASAAASKRATPTPQTNGRIETPPSRRASKVQAKEREETLSTLDQPSKNAKVHRGSCIIYQLPESAIAEDLRALASA